MDLEVIDSSGTPLRKANVDDDGQVVPIAVQNKASIIGAIRLLEEIARKDDNPHYRRAARAQADGLKRMAKRMAEGRKLSDEDILGPVLQEINAPRPRQAAQPLTIDMETKK